jgi:hypothetical protein
MMPQRLTLLTLLLGSILFLAVTGHGEEAVTKSRGVKKMKGKMTKKTADLPRHRIQRKAQPMLLHELEPEDDSDVIAKSKEIPQETTRQLKNKNVKDVKARAGGGRGREEKGAEPRGREGTETGTPGRGFGLTGTAGAGTAENLRYSRNRNVPMKDWTWGTVWMDEGSSENDATSAGGRPAGGRSVGRAGRGGTANREADHTNDADGGRDVGRGAHGRGANNGGGREANGGGGRGSNNEVNNPYLGEEHWRDQFVTDFPATPRPTRRPIRRQPPPSPTQAPESQANSTETANNNTLDATQASQSNGQVSCHLCPGGQAAAHMSRTLIGTNVKCQDIASTLATATAEDCANQKDLLPVDIEAYCGCPDKSAVGTCQFCPDGTENIWHNISIPALNDWTCQDVEDYCEFIKNPSACTEMAAVADLCCGTWEEYWAEGDDDLVDDSV